MKEPKETITMIKEKLFNDHVSDEWLIHIKNDNRVGVQKLVEQFEKRQLKKQELRNAFFEMLQYENKLKSQGVQLIAGIDEVGRGPIAGPVVAAAVILPEDFYLPGLTDSKKLSEQKRESFFDVITDQAIAVGLGIVSPTEIDLMNIHQASLESMNRAVRELLIQPEHLLIDAMKLPDVDYPQTSIIKGDAKSISIAAASVVAKVTRDRMMKDIASDYPGYGFERHMGYGTKEHLEALKTFGSTPYHRKSFAPVNQFV
uniref:ribonuclease HII n=1 Tax=uncultured Allobacillus sp. TaxID=1638025 RepID=UPI0025948B45|nr:ribonuclease HII [uncultured Allobacillus sp.]